MKHLYGISHCDTVKKARQWLEQNNIDYTFHDFRKEGLTHNTLDRWTQLIGWETLINRRSSTWRMLNVTDEQNLNKNKAIMLMKNHVTLIKRPVLLHENQITVGFDKLIYKKIFNK